MSKDNFLEYDYEGLLTKMDKFIDSISVKQSHILVSSPTDAQLMTAMNPNKLQNSLHNMVKNNLKN